MKSILAVVLTLLIGHHAFADGEADYKYREGVMKTVGGQMSSMAAILKGQVHLDNLEFHASGMADLADIVPHVFPEGSGVHQSEALPAIWEQPDEFKMAVEKFVKAAKGIATAAEDGEMSAIGPALNSLGKACKGCHDNFREEHDH